MGEPITKKMMRSATRRATLAVPSARSIVSTSSLSSSSRLLATHAAPGGTSAGHDLKADEHHDDHHHDDHHHHEDGPTGYLWSRQPGVKYPRESWETITYVGIAATLLLGWVAISKSGKVSVEEFGQMEIARRRREREQGLPQPEPLQLQVDPTKFRK